MQAFDFCDTSLDAILFTQFIHKFAEGETGEKVWLSVNYLFFISISLTQGKNQRVRQGIVWTKDLKGVLGPEIN